jgi:hypothetical protein
MFERDNDSTVDELVDVEEGSCPGAKTRVADRQGRYRAVSDSFWQAAEDMSNSIDKPV